MESCISDGNLRDALKLVNAWDMQSRYPDLNSEYEQRTMEKLLSKSLWSAAAGYAIGKPKFQVHRPSYRGHCLIHRCPQLWALLSVHAAGRKTMMHFSYMISIDG